MFTLLKVSCNHECLLSWCCWCVTSIWCYPPRYIWKCGEMAEGASGSHRCQHCDHACRKQSRPAAPASSFHWRCQSFCRTREHIFHGNISPWVHECWECLHRGADPDLSCCKQEGPWNWGWPSNLAQRRNNQCWKQGWCISCEESWMLLCLRAREERSKIYYLWNSMPCSYLCRGQQLNEKNAVSIGYLLCELIYLSWKVRIQKICACYFLWFNLKYLHPPIPHFVLLKLLNYFSFMLSLIVLGYKCSKTGFNGMWKWSSFLPLYVFMASVGMYV